jgi:predicted Fe-S protein YdhL (DUF1289 family)
MEQDRKEIVARCQQRVAQKVQDSKGHSQQQA